jgi:hypothetical protein
VNWRLCVQLECWALSAGDHSQGVNQTTHTVYQCRQLANCLGDTGVCWCDSCDSAYSHVRSPHANLWLIYVCNTLTTTLPLQCSGLLDCAYVHIHAHQVGFPTHGHHPSLPRCLFASCFWDVLSLLLVCGGSFPSPACSIKAVQVLAGAALSHLSHQGSWLASASTLRAHTHTHPKNKSLE